MKTELIIAMLGMACIGSLAAVFVLWAKIDEQKQKTADEHANYLAAQRIGNANAEYAQRIEKERDIFFDKLNELSALNIGLHIDNAKLQDFKSATLCPHNDHIWKDGVCVKCGRVKDGT